MHACNVTRFDNHEQMDFRGLHGKQGAHLVLVDGGLHQLLGTHPAAFSRSMTLSTVLGTAHTHQLRDSRGRAKLHLVLVF